MADSSKPSIGEWLNPLDPDAGLDISKLPVVGGLFKGVTSKFEQNGAENKVDGVPGTLIGIGGAVGCGLLGYKFGSNYGTLGKLACGAVCAYAGAKLLPELTKDFAGAMDYCKQNKGAKFFKTFGANVLTSGQEYNGHTADADSEPDV